MCPEAAVLPSPAFAPCRRLEFQFVWTLPAFDCVTAFSSTASALLRQVLSARVDLLKSLPDIALNSCEPSAQKCRQQRLLARAYTSEKSRPRFGSVKQRSLSCLSLTVSPVYCPVTATDITVWIISALLAIGIGASKYAKWNARNKLVRDLAAMDPDRREKMLSRMSPERAMEARQELMRRFHIS